MTLLGLVGFLSVKDNYLPGLVTAFLLESAAAVIAVFRRADFFPAEPDGLAASKRNLDAAREATAAVNVQLSVCQSELANLRTALASLEQENTTLRERIATLTSLRFKVLAVLGARSADARGIARELELGVHPGDLADLQAVIGQLESEREIERDSYSSAGYYKRRTH